MSAGWKTIAGAVAILAVSMIAWNFHTVEQVEIILARVAAIQETVLQRLQRVEDLVQQHIHETVHNR